MRSKWIMGPLVFVAASCALSSQAASAGVYPAPANVYASKTAICYVPNPDTANCLSAPHTGGSGTPITLQTWKSQGSANQQYSIHADTSFCNGKGYVDSGCGLPSFLVSQYSHKTVAVFQNSAGRCLKINGPGAGSGLATLGTCYANTTLLIIATCTNNNCFYPSIAESEVVGSIQWLCPPSLGKQVYAGSGTSCHAGNWEYVTP